LNISVWAARRDSPDTLEKRRIGVLFDRTDPAAGPPALRNSFMQADPPRAAPSIIGAGFILRGDLEGVEELLISGQVDGNIRCSRLTVETGGSVTGNIVGDEIIVRGAIKGVIRAKTVALQATARVEGDIYHALLAVEHGARFEGMSRRQDNPMQATDEEVIATAAEAGADPISLKYLVRPLLALRDPNRTEPAMWAHELSVATGCHDSDVLTETANRLTAKRGSCPTVPEIIEECERVDVEIGGQKSLSAAMYRMFALGAREWAPHWGPVPGQKGCRLRRHEQDAQWREIIRFVHSVLMTGRWASQAPDVVGAKIMRMLEQNAGVSIEATCIPKRTRVEFGIPTTARAMATALSTTEKLESSPKDLESLAEQREVAVA
jgi:cytoskeletal protein CcmA (bactofilin family)